MNYIQEALRTKSDKFFGQKMSIAILAHSMRRAIQALNNLDKLKKALYYGKNTGSENSDIWQKWNAGSKCDCLPFENVADNNEDAIDIIHSIIGRATESGESLEALAKALFAGEKFDKVNFKEEIGDGHWYDAIGLDAIGATFAEIWRINIDKLKARFPDKFSQHNAINRDLTAERSILEGEVIKDISAPLVYSENDIHLFIGYMSAHLTALHTVEVPLIVDTWESFKALKKEVDSNKLLN